MSVHVNKFTLITNEVVRGASSVELRSTLVARCYAVTLLNFHTQTEGQMTHLYCCTCFTVCNFELNNCLLTEVREMLYTRIFCCSCEEMQVLKCFWSQRFWICLSVETGEFLFHGILDKGNPSSELWEWKDYFLHGDSNKRCLSTLFKSVVKQYCHIRRSKLFVKARRLTRCLEYEMRNSLYMFCIK